MRGSRVADGHRTGDLFDALLDTCEHGGHGIRRHRGPAGHSEAQLGELLEAVCFTADQLWRAMHPGGEDELAMGVALWDHDSTTPCCAARATTRPPFATTPKPST